MFFAASEFAQRRNPGGLGRLGGFAAGGVGGLAAERAVITITSAGERFFGGEAAPRRKVFHQLLETQHGFILAGAALHRLSPVERRGRSSKVIIEG